MNKSAVGLQCFLKINNRSQRFIIHLNIGKGIFSDVTPLRQHHHNRLTRKLDLVLREWNLRSFIEDDISDRWRGDEQRTRLPVITQVSCGVNSNHPFALQGLRNINAIYPSMSVWTAHEGDVEHVQQINIVHEQSLPCE